MAIKKKTVKSKKSAVTKKTAVKKAAGRGRPKSAKKAPVKKTVAKKAAVKKTAAKKALPRATRKKTARVAKGNPAMERVKALRAEVAELKAALKTSQKREAGLEKMLDKVGSGIEKSIASTLKKEMSSLEKSLKGKPRKRRVKKAVADAG